MVARLAFGIGWNLGGPGSDAIFISSLERAVGLRDRVWIIQGLTLATTVREFTLLAETSWVRSAAREEGTEMTDNFGFAVQAPVGIHEL